MYSRHHNRRRRRHHHHHGCFIKFEMLQYIDIYLKQMMFLKQFFGVVSYHFIFCSMKIDKYGSPEPIQPTHITMTSKWVRWRLKSQPHDCLLNRLFRRRLKKTSKLRVTGLCAGNSPVTGEFPAQMTSNAENVSIWWRHHHMSWTNFEPGRV